MTRKRKRTCVAQHLEDHNNYYSENGRKVMDRKNRTHLGGGGGGRWEKAPEGFARGKEAGSNKQREILFEREKKPEDGEPIRAFGGKKGERRKEGIT